MAQIELISSERLSLMAIPILLLAFIFYRTGLNWKNLLYASSRMLTQLILVGFALNYIFSADHLVVSLSIFLFMLLAATWIASRTTADRIPSLPAIGLSVTIGSVPILLLVLGAVIPSPSWHMANYFIPLAGMILANSMNSVSLAADRLQLELKSNTHDYDPYARSLETALIPTLNSFFAVGLVSLPGMMTGQILSGVDPLIAVRYQIVVMSMVLSAAGLSSATYLYIKKRKH